MADSRTSHLRPAALLAALVLLALAAFAALPAAPAQAASCSSTFEVPIEEETDEDLEAGPDDQVIEIALGARRGHGLTVYASCGGPKKKSNPNPGFGVFPGTAAVPRRVFDERRGQAGRDAEQLAASRKKKRAQRATGRR